MRSYRTTSASHPLKSLYRALLVGYVAVVGLIVFWPTPVDRPVAGRVTAAVNSAQAAGATAVTYSSVEIAANVAMFVPLGALLVLSFARLPWWVAVVLCAALSSLIELSQLVFIAERFATLVDVAANSAGGALGAIAGALLRQHLRQRLRHR
jgi:glycopeptide antibiotics resistance protein